jgi:hypothetical protein
MTKNDRRHAPRPAAGDQPAIFGQPTDWSEASFVPSGTAWSFENERPNAPSPPTAPIAGEALQTAIGTLRPIGPLAFQPAHQTSQMPSPVGIQ